MVTFLKDHRLRELLPCLFLPTALRVFVSSTYVKDSREANVRSVAYAYRWSSKWVCWRLNGDIPLPPT